MTANQARELNKTALINGETVKLNQIYEDIRKVALTVAKQQVSYGMNYVSTAMKLQLQRDDFVTTYDNSNIIISW